MTNDRGVVDKTVLRGILLGFQSSEQSFLGTEDLNAISPVTLASAIKVPVLLAGGELDETAPVAHTKKMYEALKQAGVPVEMKIYLNEGHGNFLIENQLDWASRLSDFLDKHIGPASGS